MKDLGKIHEAEESFRKAIVINPDYAEAHNNLGNIMKSHDRLEDAEKCIARAIALDPELIIITTWAIS